MDRRTFVLLSGTASRAVLRPEKWLPRQAARPLGPAARLQFTLDSTFRWTLSYHGREAPVPLIADAELAVDAGDGLLPLSELPFPPVLRGLGTLGECFIVSGSTAGMAVEAAFRDGRSEATGNWNDAPLRCSPGAASAPTSAP